MRNQRERVQRGPLCNFNIS